MRIAVVSPLVVGASAGYRKYMRECVPLLAEEPRVNSLEVYCSPATVDEHPIAPVKLTTWPADDRIRGFPWLKSRLVETQPDVVFIPSANWLDCKAPVVSMVRNTEPLTVPFSGNSLADGFKNVLRARLAKQACTRSSRVIAVSNTVREFICEQWSISPERVGVVYHGVEHPEPNCELTQPRDVDADGPFIFTAGSVRPARGLEDAVAAMAVMNARLPGLRLVIAGKVDDGAKAYRARLKKLAARSGVTDSIVWAGQLGSAEMGWCYRNCELFAMTSRAEACPNIALEAMAYGCRIVSTTQPPMPEFFEDDVAYYEPGSGPALAEAIVAEIEAPEERQAAQRAAVVTRARAFDWRRTARATLDELQKVCKSGARKRECGGVRAAGGGA